MLSRPPDVPPCPKHGNIVAGVCGICRQCMHLTSSTASEQVETTLSWPFDMKFEMTDSTSKNVWPTSPHTKRNGKDQDQWKSHDIPTIIYHISIYFSDSSLRSNLSRLSLHLLALNRCTARDLHKNAGPRSLHSNDGCFDDFCTWRLWFLAKNWLKLCQKVAAKEFHHKFLAHVETSWTCSLGAASIDWTVPWKTWGNDAKPNRQQQTPNNTRHSNTWSTLHLQALCGLPCKQPFLRPSCEDSLFAHFFFRKSNGKILIQICKKYVKKMEQFVRCLGHLPVASCFTSPAEICSIQHTFSEKKKISPSLTCLLYHPARQRIFDDKNICKEIKEAKLKAVISGVRSLRVEMMT